MKALSWYFYKTYHPITFNGKFVTLEYTLKQQPEVDKFRHLKFKSPENA